MIRKQLGFSMVELMVAMFIQFIFLAGMVYVYSNSRVMFTVNEQLSRVQENGRYLTDVLLHDIRMAGYSGCRSIDEVVPNNIIARLRPTFASLADGITVFENGAGWDNPTALTRVEGSDVITLQSAQGSGVSLRANMITDTATIQMIINPDRLAANDLILISDCSHADLFRASAVERGTIIAHDNTANTGNQLSKAYATDAQLMLFDAHTYFIASANAEPGLYQYSFNSNTATLLAEGVENMQLLLAEDTSGDQEPDIYVNATAVMDWEAVIGVRVGLLMRSANNVAAEARAFTFNGANANTGNDTRVRKAFWSYAAMRNRIN